MPVIDYEALVATLLACLTGWLTVRHCRYLMREGVGLDQGGGHAVLILIEFTSCMAAVGAAVNL